MEYLINGIRGFCMALADSVPRVSGGTIAFILCLYIFVAGMIAISAMVLPGISGSTF